MIAVQCDKYNTKETRCSSKLQKKKKMELWIKEVLMEN